MNPALHTNSGGFVYYMHDGSAAFRFQLAGSLGGNSTGDLEQARQTAASIIGQRCLVVDLTGLTGIDAAGRELLKQWRALGAQMTVISAAEQAQIQLMTGVPVTVVGTKAGASQWLPTQAAALLVTALLALLLALAATAAGQSVGMSASATMRAPVSRFHSVHRGML
jgi:anti-anti-sigma regulatory factor